MSTLRFAWRSLRRDFKTGEIRVLALAMIVAVASVSAIGFFTDRVRSSMLQQAADILAADSRVTAGRSIDASLISRARSESLSVASTVQFPSVVLTEDDESQLVSIKAVTEGYPLRGRLSLQPAEGGETATGSIPAPGTAWVDQQLAQILSLRSGDELAVGNILLRVEQLITYEPDRSENVFEMAPRLMINHADLEAAELLGVGSRARYALLVAGQDQAVSRFNRWVEDNHAEAVNVQSVRDGNRRMQSALDRAESFLGLAAVVAVLLASAAVALAVRQFARNQANASAVLRTLGSSRQSVLAWLALRLLMVAIASALVGILIGWLAQQGLAAMLREWFTLALPAAGFKPVLSGILTALLTLAGFGLLPVVQASRVSVTRILQQDYSGMNLRLAPLLVFGIVAMFLIIWLQSGGVVLSLIVTVAVVVMLALFALVGRWLLGLFRLVTVPAWRLSVAGLTRRSGSSVVQMAAFALGLMALLLISIVRNDLLDQWQREVPENAPNAFVANVQPDQTDALLDRMRADGVDVPGMYPMIRARLVGVNGQNWLRDDDADEHQQRHARREYNLTWSDALPPGGRVVEGEWWGADELDQPLLSLEKEWAEHQDIGVGDTLTFRVADQSFTGMVVNLREVDWESFQVNFFIVGTRSMLETLPRTYLSSFYLNQDFGQTTSAWVRAFPGVLVLDVGAIIKRVKGLMDQAALAVEYVFLFTLVAGIIVLLAAVQSSQAERIRESALLRSLGATHQQLRRSVITEFAILGALSGLIAALFATLIAWAVSRYVFEFGFAPNPVVWVVAVVLGGAGIAVAGFLATRKVLRTPPVVALRENQGV